MPNVKAVSRSAQPILVGPVLLRGPVAQAVIEAILADNEGVQVTDRGGYLRVHAPSPCRLCGPTLARILGRSVNLPEDLELVMPSFSGCIVFGASEVQWQAP